MPTERKFNILSIDGGGIRGIIPLQFIKYIEEKSGKQIHECFDLIAGTSTGGLLTSILTYGDDSGLIANKRKYTLGQIEELFTEKGKKIFHTSLWTKHYQRYFKSIFLPEFKSKYLEKLLKENFKEKRISDSLVPVFITSYDLYNNEPVYFTTREAEVYPELNAKLIDICRATSAAPTYFPSHIFTYDSKTVSCIDGGVFMNNPTLGALVEVLENAKSKNYNLPSNNDLKNIYILSLGTGSSEKVFNIRTSKWWGGLRWIRPLIKIIMHSCNR